jgi:hypothetical protein
MSALGFNDVLLLGSGAVLGIVAADGNALAASLAGVGFAGSVAAKSASDTADTLRFVECAEADRDRETRNWAAREIGRRDDAVARGVV